jgi:hypothetical protein
LRLKAHKTYVFKKSEAQHLLCLSNIVTWMLH